MSQQCALSPSFTPSFTPSLSSPRSPSLSSSATPALPLPGPVPQTRTMPSAEPLRPGRLAPIHPKLSDTASTLLLVLSQHHPGAPVRALAEEALELAVIAARCFDLVRNDPDATRDGRASGCHSIDPRRALAWSEDETPTLPNVEANA
jgi:hypothetical protein